MAPPPRNTSPPTSASNNSSSSSSKAKKKAVTPAQVAFLVERYLADNGFSASLAAFRTDAAHLFTKAAPVPPKGLLPLADILHDYVALKEARLAVDSAMHAMHNLVSAYYPYHPPPPAPAPSSPTQLFAASSPPAGPAGAGAGYASPIIRYTQTSSSVVVHNSNSSEANAMSTPAQAPAAAPISFPAKKRKAAATKSAAKSKKTCIAPTASSHPKGKTVASQLSLDNSAHNTGSVRHSAMAKLPMQGSSVAKSLFNPLQPQVHSSPCTPQQSNPIADCQTERVSSSVVANAHTQQEVASSQCSMVSSKTLIVSPLKGAAYYAVERSYHVSSPLKPSSHKSSKREHVKGKLDFGICDDRPCSSEPICEEASTSSDVEKQDDFDIDFTNLDIFDGDFSFSELLVDLDLDSEGVHCLNPPTNAEVQRLEGVPVLADPMKAMAEDPTEDINSQGAASAVTCVRAITKRIKIVSPVKGRAGAAP
uniref:LisH domain-containing protein n=1 Tax=Oryza punctata TaxID=4537 RepID=A0A0E0K7F6_ORYPU